MDKSLEMLLELLVIFSTHTGYTKKTGIILQQAPVSFLGSYKKIYHFHRKWNHSFYTFACSVASENIKSFLSGEVCGISEIFPIECKLSFHQNSMSS